jgi:hypothetical protein
MPDRKIMVVMTGIVTPSVGAWQVGVGFISSADTTSAFTKH